MSDHTPGPWGFYGGPYDIPFKPKEKDTWVAGPFVSIGAVSNTEPLAIACCGKYHNVEANARLIVRAVNRDHLFEEAIEFARCILIQCIDVSEGRLDAGAAIANWSVHTRSLLDRIPKGGE